MKDPLQDALDSIRKAFGPTAISRLGDSTRANVEVFSSGSISLDRATGGGIPKGRIIEIFGPESCLDKGVFIQYAVRRDDGTAANSKGGTIKDLYHRFNKLPRKGQGKYVRECTKDSYFTAPCVDNDNRIFHNKITAVVSTGEKECFKLKTKMGFEIIATAEHKFYNGNKFVPLSDLRVGSVISVHNSTPFRVEEYSKRTNRRHVFVKSHPVAGIKYVDKYRYHRLAYSRAVVEAEMNGLDFQEYIDRLNASDLEGLKFLPRELHVHHLDEDVLNNDLSNLVVMSATDHGKKHSKERLGNLSFVCVEDQIISIENCGTRETYDVKMEAPYNNFIANNFVVHNSGKTTLASHIIAEAQKSGGIAAFVDAEHAYDPIYSEKIGVDNKKLLFSQPETGEEALTIVDTLVRSGKVAVIVIDSVAALTPRAELDGEMGAANVGLQPRMMGQAMRKLAGIASKSGTTLVFLNQIRMKIGVSWGNPETQPGGNALKFYASLRLDIRRGQKVDSNGETVSSETRVKVVKNKVAPPFKVAEFNIRFNVGIDKIEEILTLGIECGEIEKAGAFFTINGEKCQGTEKARAYLEQNPKVMAAIRKKILSIDPVTGEIAG